MLIVARDDNTPTHFGSFLIAFNSKPFSSLVAEFEFEFEI